MNSSHIRSTIRVPPAQRGVVLLLTLIALVVMTLASIALVRSVGTSNMIAGNLAFQQSTTQSGDAGIETAVAWIDANAASVTLHNNATPQGYVASRQDPNPGESWEEFWDNTLEPNGVTKTLAANAAGNTVSYVIHRLCAVAGNPTSLATGCVSGTQKSCVSHDSSLPPPPCPKAVLYRVTSRIDGPRNTVSYVQALIAK
ncbi:MAG: hypothetical protein ACKVQA_05645 [Burkholderiales bacterium]